MSTLGFARSLPPVLVYEGGKVDNPKDPGGRTNQGVTQKVYDAYRRSIGKLEQDVYKLTNAERDTIYRRQYWDAVRGDDLPDGVDFAVFDGAVNSGPVQSIKWLQRALGVNADGQLGTVTLDALNSTDNYDALVDAIVDRREAFLKALKTFKTFGKGWMARTAKVRQLGKAWANGERATEAPKKVAVHATPSPKADVEDAKPAPSKAVADAATGAGIGTAGLGGTIQTLQEQLTPFSMAGDWIGKLVVVLIVAGAALTIGGLAYRWWASRQKAKATDALDTVAK